MQEHTAPADRRPAPEDWFKERRFIEFLKFVLDQPVLYGGKLIQQRRQLKHHSPPTTPQSPSPSGPAQVFPRGTKRVHSGRPRVRNRLRRSLSSRTADRNRERDGLSEPSAYLGHLHGGHFSADAIGGSPPSGTSRGPTSVGMIDGLPTTLCKQQSSECYQGGCLGKGSRIQPASWVHWHMRKALGCGDVAVAASFRITSGWRGKKCCLGRLRPTSQSSSASQWSSETLAAQR